MGYTEYVCQLCGVSFAISRLRRFDEPESAAWDYTGFDYVEEHGGHVIPQVFCGEASGCKQMERTAPNEGSNRGEEHIAGPGCTRNKGYSGHRVSVEEMKGCRAVQCLLKKEDSWEPEADDQDFERESNYFLTGIGDGSPDEGPLEEIEPARHGIDSLFIANCLYGMAEWGLPFHPTCFEIFKKISKQRLGCVDVEGLWHWRELEGGEYEDFFVNFPREYAVHNGNEQWWNHEPGHEYLAANPIEVPGFPLSGKSGCLERSSPKEVFGPQRGDKISKDHHRTSPPTAVANTDPFQEFPAELNNMIAEYLGSKDIANLRLATPAFRQLPRFLFRRLLFEDMPWLWEAYELSLRKTDWHQLYLKAKFCWSDLKGLRNRKRIWKDVEEIVRRIAKYRSEGKIPSD